MQRLVCARVPGDLVLTVCVLAFARFMVCALFGRSAKGDEAAAPN